MMEKATKALGERAVLFASAKALLRGAGQVMFQGHAWTGFFFIVGIFWGAYESGTPLVAWGAVVGLMVATMAGLAVGLPRHEGESGLWGFNGILVGCAFPTFLGSTLYMWLALIFCAALTTWVRVGFNNVMKPWHVNSLTFPFVFCTWVFLFASRMLPGVPPTALPSPMLEVFDPGFWGFPLHAGELARIWLRGIAQVFLIDSWVTGIFFLVGLLIANRWAFLWAALSSAIALLCILVLRGAGYEVVRGLYGYSAVLTGIALATTFHRPGLVSGCWAVLGIVCTVFVQAAMDALLLPFGIPPLTAPFCIATWLFLLPMFRLDDAEPDHSHWQKRE
jgi:urea transporter